MLCPLHQAARPDEPVNDTPAPAPDTERRHRGRHVLPNTWQLCTSRTIEGRYDFSEFTEHDVKRVCGLVIVAMKRYRVQCAGLVLMSNHWHSLVKAPLARSISDFNRYVKAGIAKMVRAKRGGTGAIWDGRFHNLNLLDGASSLEKLRYLCEHAVRDGLVADPAQWPLANCIKALRGDLRIEGLARSRRGSGADAAFVPVYGRLTPLDGWATDSQGYRRVMNAMIDDIIEEYATQRTRARRAYEAAVAEAMAEGREPPRVSPQARGELVNRVEDQTFVPQHPKRSAYRACFMARGEDRAVRLREAMAQRRRDWGAYEVALHRLLTRPCEAVPELPVTCQWPTALSAAKGEPFAWASFMDIVHPGAAPGSDPPPAAAG